MIYAHLAHLITQAATSLEENAEALRDVHSFNGEWMIYDDADLCAQAAYERDTELVAELRAALVEVNLYHETARGLEQLLREHRQQGREIRYQDLAALLPATEHQPSPAGGGANNTGSASPTPRESVSSPVE